MKRHRLVHVPASTANLGPGYDVMAAALSIGLELEVEETGEFFVHCDVPGIPCDRSNLCVRAFEALKPADGLAFHIRSEIPPGAGLGSSAAAIVAGLSAADHLYELDAPLFELASELEGHPDNVAAALYGGFVVCAGDGAERLEPPQGLEGVLAIPPDPVPTEEARAALPAEIPIADAVHNVAHASLLAVGIAKRRLLAHRPRPVRPHPPGAPPAALPALDGAARALHGARRARRHDLRGRSRRAVLVHLAADRGPGRGAEEPAPDCDIRRVQFAPHGADVKEL